MVNCLLISGSPRKGNIDIAIGKVFEKIDVDKELIFLRDKDIKHCTGCLVCSKSDKCVIKDDMDELLDKMVQADVIVIGTPNYFDNVPGLLKDFIDRTNPFYHTDILKGKKLGTIVVGGGKVINSKRVSDQALTYFSNAHKLDHVSSYCFSALGAGEVLEDKGLDETVDTIALIINEK
ncbi:MAG: flavodoxin family protein [Candidatus Aenigmarchaeota archaeon]|nr:flavodoxin family protein [Candidatus Aenigmarchaeota archaeon]